MHIERREIFAFIILVIFIVNCGSSTPSESEARAIFEKQYENDIKNGIVKITKFKKVNGQSGEMMGVKFYSLKYEAEIEYPKGEHPECENPVGFQPSCGFYYHFKKIGEKDEVNGQFNFEKTENGWQVRK